MPKKAYSFLEFIKYSSLYNWSLQYTEIGQISYNKKYNLVPIKKFLKRNKEQIIIKNDKQYKRVTIHINNGGIELRDIEIGYNIGTKKQFIIHKGQFLLSKIDARNGAFGVVPESCNNAIITGNFWTFDVDYTLINPYFLTLITTSKYFVKLAEKCSNGTTNRHYLQEDLFLNTSILLPNIKKQQEILDKYNAKLKLAEIQEKQAKNLKEGVDKYILSELGLNVNIEKKLQQNYIKLVNFSEIIQWGVDKIQNDNFECNKYPLKSLNNNSIFILDTFRGKSPKYTTSNSIILNQKCNRWNYIDKKYAKTVSPEWLSKYNKEKTQENDILINSTGEGTIGRATCINKDNINLLYDSHLLLLRLNQNYVYPLFFTYLLNSSFGQAQVSYVKSAQSTKQTELGIDNLKKIKFPYPDIETQKLLVKKIVNMQKTSKDLYTKAASNRKLALEEFEKEIFE